MLIIYSTIIMYYFNINVVLRLEGDFFTTDKSQYIFIILFKNINIRIYYSL